MEKPTRLFDLPSYQLAKGPLANMLGAKAEGKWKDFSTQWFVDTAQKLAASFCQSGIGFTEWSPQKRDTIAILSENRPEWLLIDHAAQQSGAILVPIYPTIHANELLHIFREAQIKWVFVSNESLYGKVKSIERETPYLKAIFSFNKIPDVAHWEELLGETTEEYLKKTEAVKAATKPDDLATIIYTSGTSGTPKGVMLSHNNILSNVFAGYKCLPIKKEGRALSFLPLNHVYERMITYLYIYAGVPIYFAESMETIGDNIREIKPYIFATVPRLLEKVYETIMDKGMQLKGFKKKLFFWAISVGSRYELHTTKGLGYKMQLALARKLVFSKWRQALGGEVETIITGSAACQIRLLRLFTAAGIHILEGYGLTETSPVISVNRMNKKERMFGTVGLTVDKVEVKIATDGEILCKGPNIMLGYFKQPELTKEAIEDGWFKTGDIGKLIDGSFLKITDRKKELFKTSGGKYVAPLPIETKMVESPYIKQIMVVGSERKFTAALIVPDLEQIADKLKRLGENADPSPDLIENSRVVTLIQNEVQRFNANFNHVEQVKAFRLLPQEWTIEGGELTPTLKLKRKVISEKYKDTIAAIYQ